MSLKLRLSRLEQRGHHTPEYLRRLSDAEFEAVVNEMEASDPEYMAWLASLSDDELDHLEMVLSGT